MRKRLCLIPRSFDLKIVHDLKHLVCPVYRLNEVDRSHKFSNICMSVFLATDFEMLFAWKMKLYFFTKLIKASCNLLVKFSNGSVKAFLF